MELVSLFEGLDARPFRPFEIELVSGSRVLIAHPENVFIMPSRAKVRRIEVWSAEGESLALIYPEGIVALRFNHGNGA